MEIFTFGYSGKGREEGRIIPTRMRTSLHWYCLCKTAIGNYFWVIVVAQVLASLAGQLTLIVSLIYRRQWRSPECLIIEGLSLKVTLLKKHVLTSLSFKPARQINRSSSEAH